MKPLFSFTTEALRHAKDTMAFEEADRFFNDQPKSTLAEVGAVIKVICRYALPADIFCRNGHRFHEVTSEYGTFSECRFCHCEAPGDYRMG